MLRRRSLLASLAALVGLPTAAQAGRPERPYRELRNPCLDLPMPPHGPTGLFGSWPLRGPAMLKWDPVPEAVGYVVQIERIYWKNQESHQITFYHRCLPADRTYVALGGGILTQSESITIGVGTICADGRRSMLSTATLTRGSVWAQSIRAGSICAEYTGNG